MTELLTAAQMRTIEKAAIESGEVTGLELMERAGRGVVEAIFEEWPELVKTDHRAVVLCGPGNNGGDGFVVARLLKEWGWNVDVFLFGDADKLPADARTNFERWCLLGKVQDISALVLKNDSYDILVDALFGTGLVRGLGGPLADLANALSKDNEHIARTVAIDIPSGLCSDSGKALGPVIPADLSVSFHRLKLGHVLGDGLKFQGCARVSDIGIDEKWNSAIKDKMVGAAAISTAGLGKGPNKITPSGSSGRHKYDYGHALVLSGGRGHSGAARLAARGALRIGAGLVTVGCPPDAVAENAAQLTAIMLREVQDADAYKQILSDERVNALCLGPGLGKGDVQNALISMALDAGRPCVLDADALSIRFFDGDDGLSSKLHDKVVLTPHAGEFARMFPDIAENLNAPASKGPAYSKVDAAREAAKRAGCVVLFKGADTVIAAPDGRCSINSAHYERGAPWLATAGSGDVLAGFITGLLAQGFDPMQAAETASLLHVECALKFGPGLIAEDLPEILPAVYQDLFADR